MSWKSVLWCWWCLVLFWPLSGKGQENSASNTFYLSGRYLHAYAIPHRKSMRHLIQDGARAGVINFEWVTNGKRPWHQQFRNPRIGVSLYHLYLGNDEELGRSTGLYPYFQFPVLSRKKLILSYQIGWGITYVSKTYERIDNFQNIAIGSHFNAAIGSLAELEIPLYDGLQLRTGLSFIHFSNGSARKPNLGINTAGLHAGLGYRFGPAEEQPPKWEKSPPKHRYESMFALLVGNKQVSLSDPKSYFVYTFSGELGRRYSEKAMVAIGLDAIYNTAIRPQFRSLGEEVDNDLDLFQSGLTAGYHLFLGKMDINFCIGGYLRTGYKEDGFIYNRIGTRYYWNDYLVSSLTLKSHLFVADYIELGVGYRWKTP